MSPSNHDSSFDSMLSSLKHDGINLSDDEIQKVRNNDGEILYNVGMKYSFRFKVFKQLEWLRLAADQNNSKAQHQIGILYLLGRGVSRDYQEAMKWFHTAANSDENNESLSVIGIMHQQGLGVPKSIHTAIEWYTKAANKGDLCSQRKLGEIFETHNEIRDFRQAVKWHKTADDNGHDAKDKLKRLSEQGYFPHDNVNGEENIKTRVDTNYNQDQNSSTKSTEANDIELMIKEITKLKKIFQLRMEENQSQKENLQRRLNSLEEEASSKEMMPKKSYLIQQKERNRDEKLEQPIVTLEQDRIEKEKLLQQRVDRLEHDRIKMETEIQQLKNAISRFKQVLVSFGQDSDNSYQI